MGLLLTTCGCVSEDHASIPDFGEVDKVELSLWGSNEENANGHAKNEYIYNSR